MSYDKMSIASFKEALKQGKYETATGARRAIGKAATLSENEKEQARYLVDAHFSDAVKPANKPSKPGVKAVAKTAEKRAPREPAPEKRTRSPKGPSSMDLSDVETQVRLAEQIASQQSSALNALAAAKVAEPGANVASRIEEVSTDLAESLSIFRRVVQGIKATQTCSVATEQSSPSPVVNVPTPVLNGVSHENRAESLFRSSLPVS